MYKRKSSKGNILPRAGQDPFLKTKNKIKEIKNMNQDKEVNQDLIIKGSKIPDLDLSQMIKQLIKKMTIINSNLSHINNK